MKRGSSPSRRCAPAPVPAKEARGRWGKTWLSPEFVTWCKRNRLRPEYFAACALHTFALNIGSKAVTIHSSKPGHRADMFDLPDDGRGAP